MPPILASNLGAHWVYVLAISPKQILGHSTDTTQTCWGGKVVALTSAAGTPWKVAAQVHPAMISTDDATKITIPFCSLASEDENADDHKAFGEALKVDKHIETFADQIHGWMSARSNLEDKHCAAEYERGYKIVLEFYGKYL